MCCMSGAAASAWGIPMVMWQEHGFTGYVRASALQAPSVSYGLLAESLKYQNPELVVLLCDNIFSDYDYAEQGRGFAPWTGRHEDVEI